MAGVAEDLDITYIPGRRTYPLVLFIHGIGMDKNIWADPSRSRIFAGNFPVTVLLGKRPGTRVVHKKPEDFRRITAGTIPGELKSLFFLVHQKGFPVMTWSQRRPASNAELVIEELRSVLHQHRDAARNGIVLIGHSRGGLISKMYALESPGGIRAVIAMGSPFMGSSLAGWAGLVSKALRPLQPFIPKSEGTITNTLKKVNDFLKSKAIEELLPGSDFLKRLKKPLKSNIKKLCIAGSDPNLLKLYRWRENCFNKSGNTLNYYLSPRLLFSFPESLSGIMPEELRKGKGDGLVSVKSALIEEWDLKAVYPVNHLKLLFSPEIQYLITGFIEDLI